MIDQKIWLKFENDHSQMIIGKPAGSNLGSFLMIYKKPGFGLPYPKIGFPYQESVRKIGFP